MHSQDQSGALGDNFESGVEDYFRKLQTTLKSATNYKVTSSFHKSYGELIVSFYWETPHPSLHPAVVPHMDTLVFHEPSNRWTTFLTWEVDSGSTVYPTDFPEHHTSFGGSLLSFLKGQLYTHYTNDTHNEYYGQQHPMEVHVVSNKFQEKEKIFESVGLVTNNNVYNSSSPTEFWEIYDIEIPATSVFPSGQHSYITPTMFEEKEESLYSDIKRNINSKMSGPELYKLINGNPMRGQACVLKLRNYSGNKVVLYSVMIKSIASEISQ